MAGRTFKLMAVGVGLVVDVALGAALWRASSILLRRRTPDPADPPSNYGLDYDEVAFPSRDGIPLRGWWIKPVAVDGAVQMEKRTLVIVHGHNGSMDGDTGQAAELARRGFHVLLFNLRAHGTSGGEQVTFGACEYLDVLGALDWLAMVQGVNRVGLLGFSMGAGVALRVAAEDERVQAVVADGTISRIVDALAGYGRMKGVPLWVARLPAALLLMVASFRAGTPIPAANPDRWVDAVRCPVLFIHGSDDPFNTTGGVGALVATAPQGQLWLVPGAGHRDAYRLDAAAYYERVTGFFFAQG